MDLNYLLSRHQIALTCSADARSPEARHAHRGMARAYAGRIRTLQADLGATMVLACPVSVAC